MQTDGTNIAGKAVAITAASSGLGEATARHLADRGATVVLGARRMERLPTLVDEISVSSTSSTRFPPVRLLVLWPSRSVSLTM
jgi:NADP-dependent 3-hydroxy acid dehydrogenase YdfG